MTVTLSSAQRTEPKTLARSAVANDRNVHQGRQMLSKSVSKKSQPTVLAPSCMIFSIHQFERSAKPSLSPQMTAIFMSPSEKSQASSKGNSAKLINAGSRQKGV
jgi:hypothetical protein